MPKGELKTRRFSPTEEAEVAVDRYGLWKRGRRNPNAENVSCQENGASSHIKIVTKSSWRQTPSNIILSPHKSSFL